MRAGQQLVVEAYNRDLKKKLATGTLVTIDNQIDANTGTIRCKAVFPNEDNALFPNQFVNARLLVETKRDATIVPASAIQRSVHNVRLYRQRGQHVSGATLYSVPARAMTCPSTAVWRLARWSSSRGGQSPARHEGCRTHGRCWQPKGEPMSPSRPFILRPVATSLLMVAILLAGAVAYYQLPVSALPQVDYPTIQVLTFYPGASPDVMASAITAPSNGSSGRFPA